MVGRKPKDVGRRKASLAAGRSSTAVPRPTKMEAFGVENVW